MVRVGRVELPSPTWKVGIIAVIPHPPELNEGTTTLKNIARIEEVNRIIEVLQSIGVNVKWQNLTDVVIKVPHKLNLLGINHEAAKKTRSVLMFIGPLIHRSKNFIIPYAGGCNLGRRTVLPHLYALEEFGVKVETRSGHYEVSSRIHTPRRNVVLYESGDTTTENALLAAALTPGITVIKMASANYMVQDLCFFLEKLGVKIEGIGSSTLKVYGASKLNKNVTYYPSEDPVEAMTFISAAVTTNSSIKIKRVPLEFLELELLKLEKMGLRYDASPSYKADTTQTTVQ